MNSFEKLVIVLLFIFLGAWFFYYKTCIVPTLPPPVRPPAQGQTGTNAPAAAPEPAASNALPAAPVEPPALAAAPDDKPAATHMPPPEPVEPHQQEEQVVVLSNRVESVSVSSWGGGIKAVTLLNYRDRLDKKSGPLVLDFSIAPALVYDGIPGLATNGDFTLVPHETGRSVQISRRTRDGLLFTRTLLLDEDYRLRAVDVLKNEGTAPVSLSKVGLHTGPIRDAKDSSAQGYTYLGIDSLASVGGEDVVYWSYKGPPNDKLTLSERFLPETHQGGCSMMKGPLPAPLPTDIAFSRNTDTDWVAAKNKFFVQILNVKGGAVAALLHARRKVPETETPKDNRSWSHSVELDYVIGGLRLRDKVLAPGESVSHELTCYIGPKAYEILKPLGYRQDEVMEFGFWAPVSKILLFVLNACYRVIPNYGIAIILLVILVRIVFWPLTHKSTESMKKMQQLQPLVNELREQYKDKPQKMNQEIMALYKEKKVNPLSGCLPILVQIPVFIALFTVLRCAVELRFTEFLWIRDLSEPENLLAGVLPIPLNILPILMTVTMVWQQKLTPMTGDAQQQKMMLYLMPALMLFMFYFMASALVLYWTVSQCSSIIQLLWQKRQAGEGPSPMRTK